MLKFKRKFRRLKVKIDPRCVKAQKKADLHSSDVQDTAIDGDDFQIGDLKNQVGYKEQKISGYQQQNTI